MPKCKECGNEAVLVDDNWVCHKCKIFLGKNCEVYSRVVGYLRPIKQWNKGKQQEFEDRQNYKIKESGKGGIKNIRH